MADTRYSRSKMEDRESKMSIRKTRNPRRSVRVPRSSTLDSRRTKHRAGFSFAEVMFAVVILGIGFIMVAAVFPVAIQQTQATGEESIAAALARQAADAIASLPGTVNNPLYSSSYVYNPATPTPATDYKSVQSELVFPPTMKNYIPGNLNNSVSLTSYAGTPAITNVTSSAPGSVVAPFVGPRWDLLKGNIIPPSDPRYSYVCFYRRDGGSSNAQLIVVAVANRQRPVYDPILDVVIQNSTNQVQQETVTTIRAAFPAVAVAPNSPTWIYPDSINDTASSTNNFPQEGFYVTTPFTGITPPPAPWNRTYRLGRQISGTPYGPGVFELDPADNMTLTAGSTGWGTPGVWNATTGAWNNGSIADPPLNNAVVTLYPTATLQPTVAYAQLQTTPSSASGQIALTTGPSTSATDAAVPPAAAPGAFVIIADDFPFNPASPTTLNYQIPPTLIGYSSTTPITTLISYRVGALNGRIFRLGQPVPNTTGIYNLDPAYGMRPPATGGPGYSPDTFPNPDFLTYEATNPTNAITGGAGLRCKVFIVGQGRDNPAITVGGPGAVIPPVYGKGAQDIGAYSTYFQVR